ncbi:type 1 glutamine amidotransferase domain-containing protein [Sphingomonas glaciei]|uniref:Type 1 glutamine amidotransferase n=1 Tax=Sphingomonas glaciei TaxID=2938948 RepID=A0ABY5MZJ6_9SPHN|nr:type 1 glutamine amidotransferase domain-containing protein [Sphingomonas glaciei]UUR08478.1 type 1 glutamine amidotransferase [Sphingomonas glaciei]
MQTKVLIMATSGFEEDELFVPLERLRAAGCDVRLAAPSREPIRATVMDDPGRWITPDLTIAEADSAEWDALLLPGGLINPDHLRTDKAAVALVRAFLAAGKAVGAICHGPWLLVEADGVRGRQVTGWRSIRTDLSNAGGVVSDGPVVRDGSVVTAVGPEDSAAFADALLAAAKESLTFRA